jgi:hypothetical protein
MSRKRREAVSAAPTADHQNTCFSRLKAYNLRGSKEKKGAKSAPAFSFAGIVLAWAAKPRAGRSLDLLISSGFLPDSRARKNAAFASLFALDTPALPTRFQIFLGASVG